MNDPDSPSRDPAAEPPADRPPDAAGPPPAPDDAAVHGLDPGRDATPAPEAELPSGEAPPADGATPTAPPPPAAEAEVPQRDFTVAAAVAAFAIACGLVIAGYVALNGGALRAQASAHTYDAPIMSVPRGAGRLDGDALVAGATGNDVLIVAVKTDFRARDLGTVAWDIAGLPTGADVRLLFSSDYTPKRAHNRPLAVEDGVIRPLTLAGDRDWLGRITGLAIVVRAPGATLRIHNVTVKPLSLAQLLGDRIGEWFRFEPWTGTSINAVVGGTAAQSLPLPVPLTIAALLALGIAAVARRFAPARIAHGVPALAALVFVIAWAVLDVRWTANLARQVAVTVDRYGGKSAEERALAAEDADLVAFLDRAKALLPADPQRVVVLAEAHYFRGRAAWHLLPHRAMWEPALDAPPAPGVLRAGDFLVVWQRPGTQFDRANGRVRFDNGVELPASLLLADRGSAVFAIH